jgi:hypothetical protein
MSGFTFGAQARDSKSTFSYTFEQSHVYESRESNSLFKFGFGYNPTPNTFSSQNKETKKVKKQLSQEELDARNKQHYT